MYPKSYNIVMIGMHSTNTPMQAGSNEAIIGQLAPQPKPTVLVVDDEKGPRESMGYILNDEFQVEEAVRPSEALRMIREKAYDAIVMDLRMPEMDGFKTIEELRKIDADVGVIVLTGYTSLESAQATLLAGGNQMLKKPPEVAVMLDSVRRQVRLTTERRKQGRIYKKTALINAALKEELMMTEPKVWLARASAELVHDLTNPLMVTIGYASLLADEARVLAGTDPTKAQKLIEYAEMVARASEYAHYLVDNWRETSAPVQHFDRVDLVQVVNELYRVIFFNHSAISIEGNSGVVVRGLRFQLMRVFQNLIKNSLEAGATRLVVTVAEDDAGPIATIADNGKGMSNEECMRTEGHGFSTKEKGMGLGMSICRHILKAHGATFDLKSRLGLGTTITVRFPKVSV